MVRIEGVVVTERDAWWLVDRLRARGRAEDTTTAIAIEVGIESGEDVARLTTPQRNSIRDALGQHPGDVDRIADTTRTRQFLSHQPRARKFRADGASSRCDLLSRGKQGFVSAERGAASSAAAAPPAELLPA